MASDVIERTLLAGDLKFAISDNIASNIDSVVFFSFLSFFLFNFIRCPCNVFDVIVSP